MSSDSEFLSRVLAAVVAPVRLSGRAVGYAVSILLVLLVPVVVVSACTLAWLLVLQAVDLAVGLSLPGPFGIARAVGLPGSVNGIPLVYPSILGVLTGLLLGWPSTDRETEFSPPITIG